MSARPLAWNKSPSLASYHCDSGADACHGENLGTGEDDAVAALIANCVPPHQ